MTDTSKDAVDRLVLAMIRSGSPWSANMLTALADERDAANARADSAEAQLISTCQREAALISRNDVKVEGLEAQVTHARDAALVEAVGRCKVPPGQTPLNDKLSHPLLDVFNEGSIARDRGTVSPYHGHSLEHLIHATGWVQRDLRLALDAKTTSTPPDSAELDALVAEARERARDEFAAGHMNDAVFRGNVADAITTLRDTPAPAVTVQEVSPHPYDDCVHSDDHAANRFVAAMKGKLAAKRLQGRGGWDRKDEVSNEYLSRLLREHVDKGDPVDVANLAMMIHQRGERISDKPAPAVTVADFPPSHCTAWEDCNHDGVCHDPKQCGAAGPNTRAIAGGGDELQTAPAVTVQEADDIDARMKALGMIPLSEMLNSHGPMEKWMQHAHVHTFPEFVEWVSMKQREYMSMRMRYEIGDKDKGDDMFEWVFAHAAVFDGIATQLRAIAGGGDE